MEDKKEKDSFPPKWMFYNFTEGPVSICIVLETSHFLFKTNCGAIIIMKYYETVKLL